MGHDIEWINTTASTVDYSDEAVAAYQATGDDGIDAYTEQFEKQFGLTGGRDIGGLVVYSNDCVYDYENFCGWVRAS